MTRLKASYGNPNRGLTLVELLVSISLMAIVMGMFMVAYRQAATEASNIRTQSTIRKISEVLISRMQEYENYPINFARAPGNFFGTPIPGNAVEALPSTHEEFEPKGILLERLRVMLLREMIAQEMPDHYQDIKYNTPMVKNYWSGLVAPSPIPNQGPQPVVVTASESPRARRIKTRLAQTNPSWWQQLNSTDPNQSPADFQIANAEFLYLIVEDSSLNGSPAIESFGKSEIGDTDGDGLLEFLDSYRQPICWIRWPTGFPETTRFHPDLLDSSFNRDGFSNYAFSDPLDPRKADPGYRVNQTGTPVYKPGPMAFPLVISSGPDRDPAGGFGFGIKMWHQRNYAVSQRYKLDDRPNYQSASVTDVVIPVPYDLGGQSPLAMCDPWYPRVESNPPTFEGLRLGAIPPVSVNPFYTKLFEDDITNYSINGAYQ